MKKICNIFECTGCGACHNICPKSAITMQMNVKGFYNPIIDAKKCINCGLCEKICPLDNYKSNNIEDPRVFAFQNKDEETLYKCASGGAFALFAKHTIEKGGVVYGVIYDENFVVCHTRTDNLTDLEKMYSSKYVQSDTRDTFKQAKSDLENGKKVLFSGTPCQIAGLKSYLQKDYENLITIDLVCHGTPSPLVFEKYKKEISKKINNKEEFLNINFRSKIQGWKPQLITTIQTTKQTFDILAKKDNFMRLFLNNLSINDSCLNCQFNKLPRVADLTLGDFWGVDDYDKSLNNEKGLSVILINSERGLQLYNDASKNCTSKEVPLDVVIKKNKNIIGSSTPHIRRSEFFKDIQKGKSLKCCVNKYLEPPLYKKIYNLFPQFVKDFIKYKILKKK